MILNARLPYSCSIFIAVFALIRINAAPPKTNVRIAPTPVPTPTTEPWDCTGAAFDGTLEIGCWGYRTCVEGQLTDHFCAPETVLERDSMSCVPVETAHTDCVRTMTCEGRANGMYADLGHKCQTYFRCRNGKTLGRYYCPADLVFHEVYQTCNFPSLVPKPCGVKIGRW